MVVTKDVRGGWQDFAQANSQRAARGLRGCHEHQGTIQGGLFTQSLDLGNKLGTLFRKLLLKIVHSFRPLGGGVGQHVLQLLYLQRILGGGFGQHPIVGLELNHLIGIEITLGLQSRVIVRSDFSSAARSSRSNSSTRNAFRAAAARDSRSNSCTRNAFWAAAAS